MAAIKTRRLRLARRVALAWRGFGRWVAGNPRAVLALVGIMLLSAGAALYSRPAGLIVAGGLIFWDAVRRQTRIE